MKRIIATILMITICTGLFALTFVSDNAGLLTQSQREALEQRLIEIHQNHPIDIAIVTTDSTNGKSVEAYADDWYDFHNFNLSGGILLLIDMGSRYAHISTVGTMINDVNDNAVEVLLDYVLDDARSVDWNTAFNTFIDMSLEYDRDPDAALAKYGYSPSYDYSNQNSHHDGDGDEGMNLGGRFIAALAIGLTASLITVLVMRSRLNMVHALETAGSYEVSGSFHLTERQDILLHKSVSRTARSSSSGGSSTHRSSSGVSHGGGGRGF